MYGGFTKWQFTPEGSRPRSIAGATSYSPISPRTRRALKTAGKFENTIKEIYGDVLQHDLAPAHRRMVEVPLALK
jgi:hypothetical protein